MAKVVPESCQRTDGIEAWLDIKADKEAKRMEKEEKRRDRKASFNTTSPSYIYIIDMVVNYQLSEKFT